MLNILLGAEDSARSSGGFPDQPLILGPARAVRLQAPDHEQVPVSIGDKGVGGRTSGALRNQWVSRDRDAPASSIVPTYLSSFLRPLGPVCRLINARVLGRTERPGPARG